MSASSGSNVPQPRRRLADIAIVAFSVLATILLAEIAIRWVKPQGMALVSPYVEQHPDYLFKVKSRLDARHRSFNFDARYYTDALGLRVRAKNQDVPPAGPGVRRVLCMGDSVTFGIGVDAGEAFPARLEGFLQEMDPRERWQVLNFGQPGWGTSQELLWLEKEGFALEPDLLIVGFTLNDPHDDWTNGLMKVEGGRLVRSTQTRALESNFRKLSRSIPFYKFLCENSFLLTLTRKFVTVVLQKRGEAQRVQGLPRDPAAILLSEREETLLKFDLSEKIFQELILGCRKRNIPVILSFSPWPVGTSTLGQSEDPHAVAKSAFKSLNVPILDMNQHLIKVAQEKGYQYSDVYIVGDGHMTALGNGIVAEELARQVLARRDLWNRKNRLETHPGN